MIWNKITIDTTTEAADIVASVLFDNNIVGAEIEDNQNLSDEDLSKMYVDIPKINVDDGKSKVSFYVSIGDKDKDHEEIIDKKFVDNSYMPSSDNIFKKEEFDEILSNIKLELEEYRSFVDMGSLKISEIELDDNDFLKKWKENFKKIDIDDISILPSFEMTNEIDNSKINIFIEPGNAFGTGQHSTTKLCVKSLKKIMSNRKINKVLDIGSGSGILSIIAKKLGASTVLAIDVDENVEFNLLENLKLNDIKTIYKLVGSNILQDNYSFDHIVCTVKDLDDFKVKDEFLYSFGNILTDDSFKDEFCKIKYDIILANILSPIIISLIEKCHIHEMLEDNGYLILSGIIKEKEKEVLDTINKFIKYKDLIVDYDEEWVSFTINV